MDVTLTSRRYLGIGLREVPAYVHAVWQKVQRHGGTLTVLWHNDSLITDEERECLVLLLDILS